MKPLAIGHAELYIYPEKIGEQDTIVSPQRIDVATVQELVQVLHMMPTQSSFTVLLSINECIVGNGKYFMDTENITILHEYGACVGFLVNPLTLLREMRQHETEV